MVNLRRTRVLLVAALITCAASELASADPFILTSPAFAAGGAIPKQYTCEGADRSPPLAWQGAPVATRSLVLMVDDPDAPDPAAPTMTWVHWLLYAMPTTMSQLPEDAVPAAMRAGTNDFQRTRYGGPCPPIGRHRYYFKLSALDIELADLGAPTKAALETAMRGHVLASALLIGTYKKGD